MARKPTRIAPPAIIAQAAATLYAQIAASPAIPDAERELYINATTKAWNQLMDGVKFEREDDEFIFPSRTRAGMAHRVNGTCDCEASAEQGQPCWHRAAKKLVLIMEAPTTPRPAAATPPPAAPVAPPPPPAPRGPGRNPAQPRIRQLITPAGTAQEEVDQLFAR
jgi:hypothetical protein